ncbi:MAG: RNA polymerase sigma factor [Actinobacteria bacterium]|nr:RNA polymerase sigma factor [Actinomycetota bacterium]
MGRVALVDETVLAAAAARGDKAAFERLYDLHAARVHAHCARQLGTVQDADDLTAVVFLEAWRRRGSVRVVDGSVLPWLLVTATNVARNHRRGMRRYRAVLARLPAPDPVPDHGGDVAHRMRTAEGARTLAVALASLGATDRQVVSLCLLEDLTYQQAGDVLGLSHAAVRSRLSRSRRALREALLAAGYDPDRDGEDDHG